MSAARARLLVVSALCFALIACATREQAQRLEPSGFLGDYAQLEPGRGDQPALLYIAPEADFADYARVQIDPVTIWRKRGADLGDVPETEGVRLARYFDAALRRFKRACEKAGVLTELRRREFYEKPTQERKRKKAAAVNWCP